MKLSLDIIQSQKIAWLHPLNTTTGTQPADKAILEKGNKLLNKFAYKLKPTFNRKGHQCNIDYNGTNDTLGMPIPERFKSTEDYFNCLYHEYIHSTGHATRLYREVVVHNCGLISADLKALEELIAELGAITLCELAELDNKELTTNSLRYLKHHLNNIEKGKQKRYLNYAIKEADKAVKFLLDKSD